MSTNHPASRINLATARIVDQAVGMAKQTGRREAAAFMDQSGISFAVIVRVLSGAAARSCGDHPDRIA